MTFYAMIKLKLLVKLNLQKFNMTKRICDNCNNFEITMDNTREICHGKRSGSLLIANMPSYYIEERMNGNKKYCKEFKKI